MALIPIFSDRIFRFWGSIATSTSGIVETVVETWFPVVEPTTLKSPFKILGSHQHHSGKSFNRRGQILIFVVEIEVAPDRHVGEGYDIISKL